MAIKIKLELIFDEAADIGALLQSITVPQPINNVLPDETNTFQARIRTSEIRAQPLMDLLAAELEKDGLHPSRLQPD
jgi:hypothetical protein